MISHLSFAYTIYFLRFFLYFLLNCHQLSVCSLGQVDSSTLALNNHVLLRSQLDRCSLFGRREMNYGPLDVTFFTIHLPHTQHTNTCM